MKYWLPILLLLLMPSIACAGSFAGTGINDEDYVTLVIFGDSQKAMEGYRGSGSGEARYSEMSETIDWIFEKRDTENIAAVMHVGDMISAGINVPPYGSELSECDFENGAPYTVQYELTCPGVNCPVGMIESTCKATPGLYWSGNPANGSGACASCQLVDWTSTEWTGFMNLWNRFLPGQETTYGIPALTVRGNHDNVGDQYANDPDREPQGYNQRFSSSYWDSLNDSYGPRTYRHVASYDDEFENGDGHAWLISFRSQSILVVAISCCTLEGIPDAQEEWAIDVMNEYSNIPAIMLVHHADAINDSFTLVAGDRAPNLIAVFGGHDGDRKVSILTDTSSTIPSAKNIIRAEIDWTNPSGTPSNDYDTNGIVQDDYVKIVKIYDDNTIEIFDYSVKGLAKNSRSANIIERQSFDITPVPSYVKCSDLPDPGYTPISVTTSSPNGGDLHEIIKNNCATGCTLSVAGGTYNNTNVTIGPASEISAGRAKVGSLTGATGEIYIKAADPNNKPVLRATVDAKSGVLFFVDVDARIRLKDLVLDGRREDHSEAIVSTPCTDANSNNICDDGSQTTQYQSGLWISKIVAGNTQACLENVDVINTIHDGVFIRNAINSTIENSTASGIGCTPSLCPNYDVPADAVTNTLTSVGRGFNFVDSENVAIIDSESDLTTKMGAQCFQVENCHIMNNTITNANSAGVSLLSTSGAVVSGNTISNIGFDWAHNLTTDYNGHGVSVSIGDYSDISPDVEILVKNNNVHNTWGAGYTFQTPSGTGNSNAQIILEDNVANSTCNGTTLTTQAAFILGDPTDQYFKGILKGNTSTNTFCDSAFRIQNLEEYIGYGNTVSGTNPDGIAVIYDDILDLDERILTVNEDINIDVDSVGTIDTCNLNSGATITGATSGTVIRTNCGP